MSGNWIKCQYYFSKMSLDLEPASKPTLNSVNSIHWIWKVPRTSFVLTSQLQFQKKKLHDISFYYPYWRCKYRRYIYTTFYLKGSARSTSGRNICPRIRAIEDMESHVIATREEARWHYLGPLVFEGPARSTITSYNCRPFCVIALVWIPWYPETNLFGWVNR